MKVTRVILIGACLAAAGNAAAGALEECLIKGDQDAVTRCLVEQDHETQAALNKAEGDAGKKARELDVATGRSGAAAALARTMRAFGDYRKAQCDFVRAMYPGPGADQRQLGCMVDMTRRRVRDLQN